MAVERISPDSEDDIELLFHWQRYFFASGYVEGKCVLDLASGEGYGSYLLAHHADSVIGIDIDCQTVERASQEYLRNNLRYITGSATNIPLGDNSIDVIVSFETIEHMDSDSQSMFLGEINRVLKKDGLLIISTPDKSRTDSFSEKNPYHVKELYKFEFEQLLSNRFCNMQLFKQEVNLGSFLWVDEAEKQSNLAMLNGIDYSQKFDLYTGQALMGIHLYLIAVCSDAVLPQPVNHVCFEVGRLPIERLWSSLSMNLEQIKTLKREYSEQMKALKRTYNARLKSVLRLYEEQRDLVDAQETKLFELNQHIETLQQRFTEIESMRTWKLIKHYQSFMDNTYLGRGLRRFLGLAQR